MANKKTAANVEGEEDPEEEVVTSEPEEETEPAEEGEETVPVTEAHIVQSQHPWAKAFAILTNTEEPGYKDAPKDAVTLKGDGTWATMGSVNPDLRAQLDTIVLEGGFGTRWEGEPDAQEEALKKSLEYADARAAGEID